MADYETGSKNQYSYSIVDKLVQKTVLMKIGIFYGSTTGTTAEVAGKIAKVMGVESADVHNVADAAPDRKSVV